jgi:hypothetical protein
MPLSMYTASVPVFVRMLNNLDAILDKAAAHAEAKKIDPSVLINARLFPDMLPFSKQIQIASDTVKYCATRLAGLTAPAFEDTETTFPELKQRIRKTIDYLNTFKPEQIDGSEEKTITMPLRNGEMTLPGLQYLQGFVYSNFYFHVTTAYGILRHNGVELGKKDFLGAL